MVGCSPEITSPGVGYMSMKITYFVHGTSTDNERHLATGWDHGKLSIVGECQAKELGQLARGNYKVVFCSDLRRAIDTATLAFGDRFKIITDARLREINYGDLTGKPGDQVKRDLIRHVDHPFPNGESYRDVERRIKDFIEAQRGSYEGKHFAVVAHQAPQLALDVLVKGKSWREAIEKDWRLSKAWKPGWDYIVE